MILYACGVLAVRRAGGTWPPARTVCWAAGLGAAGFALAGPLATAAHHDFTAHAAAHLLLGMAAPLLLVLGAPVTLALRALPVRHARTLSRLLRCGPVRVLTHPVPALLLNAGGLWLLYAGGHYHALHGHPLVPVHIFAAGYLFTAAIVGADPNPHRAGLRTRGVVLLVFLASHAILAKHLYGNPVAPHGRTGAELMYYGGDLIDAALIVLLCREWYGAADPRRRTRARAAAAARPPWRLPAEMRLSPSDPGRVAQDGAAQRGDGLAAGAVGAHRGL